MFNTEKKIRSIQENLLKLLKLFHNICIENKVLYSLHGGTLLGAVREKGFIPWDDDIDVTMTRNDFERFEQCIKTQKKGIRLIQVCGIYKFCDEAISKDLWIDVFIYDSISCNKILQKLKCFTILLVECMTRSKEDMVNIRTNVHKKWEIIVFKLINVFGIFIPKKTKKTLLNKVSTKLFVGSGDFIHRSNDKKPDRNIVIPSEWMSEYVTLPFEDANFLVTKNYHEVLTKSYGNDYMTPIKDELNSENHANMRNFLSEH